MEAPNYSLDTNHPISKLKQIIIEQQEELVKLCTLVEYLRGFLQGGIDEGDVHKYEEKLAQFQRLQNERFQNVDELINKNIIQMKKGITTDQTVLIFGKEIRKIEASLRTLALFTMDVIKMSRPNGTAVNRSEDRLYYFDVRSVEIDMETRLLLQKMAYI